MSAPTRGRTVECVDDCGRIGPNHGRGLVSTCWHRHHRHGTLDRFPVRTYGALPALVQDALALRRRYGRAELCRGGDERGCRRPSRTGITWEQVAERLGVPFRRLEKARERAGWPDVR